MYNSKPKKGELKNSLKELIVALVLKPEELKNLMMVWSNGFYRYSLTNTLLVKDQREQRGISPKTFEEEIFASQSKWKELGRYIRFGVMKEHLEYWIQKPSKGHNLPVIDPETGKPSIDILTGKPETKFVPSAWDPIPTWGYEYTDGKPLEINPGNHRMVQYDKVRFDWFAENAPAQIKRIPKGDKFEDGFTNGIDIVINDPGHKGCEAAMLATLFHKTAHVFMHGRNPEIGEDIERSVRELEAIAVEYAVCSYFGIENHRAQMEITNWTGDVDELEQKADRILTTAEKIIKHYEACAKEDASPCTAAPSSGDLIEEVA